MVYVIWVFRIAFWVLVLATLHYTLPQWDTVRITDTYETRINPAENALFWAQADAGMNQTAVERDVFFIQTQKSGGGAMIYRNEDTGWGWPPYLKFDTANLQADAADLRSTQEDPRWVAIKHYGWRIELMTIFPNAITIKPVEGPDARVIPWISIAILIGLAAVYWAIRVRVLRWWDNRVGPRLEGFGDRFRRT